MARTLNIDFESRSACDIKESGAYVYARHPSTSILCCCYSIDGGPVMQWPTLAVPKMPTDLRAALDDPACRIHAWNSQFERLIFKYVLGEELPLRRFFCTAAWARSRGLPGGLEDALRALNQRDNLTQKRTGSSIMLRLSQPTNDVHTGAAPEWAPITDEDYYALLVYCAHDVKSEADIQKTLSHVPMSDREWEEFFHNEEINDRGLPIDRPLALAAAAYGDAEKAELTDKLVGASAGLITSVNQHQRVKDFLRDFLPEDLFQQFFVSIVDGKKKVSTDKRAREGFLLEYASAPSDGQRDTPDDELQMVEHCARVLQILDDASKASVSKFAKMAAFSIDDGRAHGAYLLAGAGQTKRYSSRGIQMHNLPRKAPKNDELERVIRQARERSLEQGTVMATLSSLLRPTICAPVGRCIVWGDWNSVEARAMPWLAGAEEKLNLYREGVDVYRVNASAIFTVPAQDATDDQRQIGKVSELSLQFGGAVGALSAMARSYGINLNAYSVAPDHIVQAWRTANQWAPRFSYALMDAFCSACMRSEGADYKVGPITYRPVKKFGMGKMLTVEAVLPDGTSLYYPGLAGGDAVEIGTRWEWFDNDETEGVTVKVYRTTPVIKRAALRMPAGHPVIDKRSEMYRPEGRMQVEYQKTLASGTAASRVWHGLLAENVTQALCAALLRDTLGRVACALKRAKLDAFIIGHTHDEIILESADACREAAGKLLKREMERVPEWLPGFPLGADIKTAARYGK